MSVLNVFQCYLFAWVFWTTFSIGCVGLLCLHHAVRGSWGLPILRVLEAGAKMIPVMGLFFLPIIVEIFMKFDGNLYPWLNPGDDPILLHKAGFNNPIFFTVRTLVYFGIWIFFTTKLTNSELQQDKTKDERLAMKRSTLGAWGIVFTTLTVTFAFTDWVMSLDPHWYSTIFGAWFLLGSCMSAFAFSVIYVTRRAVKGQQPWKDAVSDSFRKDAGSLLVMFVLVWAYFSLSQFLIIWSGNLPQENTYYVTRFNDPVLSIIGGGLILCQWLFPFVGLLAPRSRKDPKMLLRAAGWIICMRFIDVFWTVMPFFMQLKGNHVTRMELPMVVTAFGWAIALGIVWVMGFNANMAKEPPLPTHDPRLQDLMEAAHHAA